MLPQAVPVHTCSLLPTVLKYKAPVISASPSLSTVGAEPLAPKYLSSKLSKEAAALVSLVAALFS